VFKIPWEWVNHGVSIAWTPVLPQALSDGSTFHHLQWFLREIFLDPSKKLNYVLLLKWNQHSQNPKEQNFDWIKHMVPTHCILKEL
jgi:hypothetical protein